MNRNLHIPRVCHQCGAPMGGNDDNCWRCGTLWVAANATTPATPAPEAAATT